ncbi:MAG: hypothetical protein A2293_10205 [Elusimicrobia bacterium RIFOXYB2_FULL_49_7]|nr:MAG: hypothetical protein A2293_10205 [Elusimicrobia bacterium RIFOXYB2_FULL_49_7]
MATRKPTSTALHSKAQLDQLIRLCETLAIHVREEEMEGRGGLYQLKGQRHLLLPQDLTMDEKRDILIDALKRENLEGVFVLPALRSLLEGSA